MCNEMLAGKQQPHQFTLIYTNPSGISCSSQAPSPGSSGGNCKSLFQTQRLFNVRIMLEPTISPRGSGGGSVLLVPAETLGKFQRGLESTSQSLPLKGTGPAQESGPPGCMRPSCVDRQLGPE
ncbi:polycystin-2 [Platysternon megacephalum]|uniref:Polycystin-2 n=1 Tax=Platysternon megacephalum TaxID=55544 RepID=A0A4D9E6L3_9SAUR|nr:polycystin-2 [Platysternon megacephalum]